MEEKKEDIDRLKNIQLDLHKDFIEVVENSRSNKLKKDSGIELFSGEFWSGRKAKELGLIDGMFQPPLQYRRVEVLRNHFYPNIFED